MFINPLNGNPQLPDLLHLLQNPDPRHSLDTRLRGNDGMSTAETGYFIPLRMTNIRGNWKFEFV